MSNVALKTLDEILPAHLTAMMNITGVTRLEYMFPNLVKALEKNGITGGALYDKADRLAYQAVDKPLYEYLEFIEMALGELTIEKYSSQEVLWNKAMISVGVNISAEIAKGVKTAGKFDELTPHDIATMTYLGYHVRGGVTVAELIKLVKDARKGNFHTLPLDTYDYGEQGHETVMVYEPFKAVYVPTPYSRMVITAAVCYSKMYSGERLVRSKDTKRKLAEFLLWLNRQTSNEIQRSLDAIAMAVFG